MKYLFIIPFLSLTLFAAENTIDEVHISADRVSPTSIGNAMSSSMIINQEDIRAKQYETVYEVLHDVPGVDIVATTPGQTASVFIRGEQSEQALVLIDGVEFNDPTSPGNGADLGSLRMDNIERIEIIRGAQTVLFPGVGGVINIITKSGANGPLQTTLNVQGGSFGTIGSNLSTRGKTGDAFEYSMSAGVFSTDGIPIVAGGTKRDGNRTTTFSGKFGKRFSSSTRVDLVTRYYDAKTDLDLPPVQVPNFQAFTQDLINRIQGVTRYGIWEPTLGFSYRTINRNSLNYGSNPNTHFNSDGNNAKIDLTNRFFLNEQHLLTWGLETSREQASIFSNYGFGDASTNQHILQSDSFLQYEYINDDGFFATAGARIDYHSTFGWQPLFRVAPGYKMKSTLTTFRASAGSGFKPPSIYQLYGEYGNAALKPELAFSFDAGVEQTLIKNRLLFIVTAFYNKLTNMVDFETASNTFINIGKAHTEGIELSQSTRLFPFLKWETAYTYLETRDDIAGSTLLRRPRNRLSNSIVYSSGKWEAALTYLLVGTRDDLNASTFIRMEMPTYQVFNLAATYQLFRDTQLLARIENLFNSRYQVIDAYATPGFAMYGGFRQSL